MQNQTYADVGKIMSRGQIVIPKKLREELLLDENALVGFIRVNGGILLQPLQPKPASTKKGALEKLIIKEPTITSEEFLRGLENRTEIGWDKADDAMLKADRKKDKQRLQKILAGKPYWK